MIAIGTLAKETGVPIETIRYYERAGVLPRPRRGANGRRVYEDQDVRRLVFVRHARELGFELKSVRALLALQNHPDRSCRAASSLAAAQLAAVESRLNRLEGLRDELALMVNACANERVADCRIIEALART